MDVLQGARDRMIQRTRDDAPPPLTVDTLNQILLLAPSISCPVSLSQYCMQDLEESEEDLSGGCNLQASRGPQTIQTEAEQGISRQVLFAISGSCSASWEIHRPQKAVIKLGKAGAFAGKKVIDLGCGLGDNSLYIHEHAGAKEVIGIDLVPRCLTLCRAKAKQRGLHHAVQWIHSDLEHALDVPDSTAIHDRCDVLLDCGTFHCLPATARAAYVSNLTHLCEKGGLLYLLAFSEKSTPLSSFPDETPCRISLKDINASFTPASGWEVERSEECCLENHPSVNAGKGLDHDKPEEFEQLWRGSIHSFLAVVRKL